MEEQQKLANSKEVLAFLATKFPKCFSLQSEAQPLKIGIFHDLSERLTDDSIMSKRLLRMSLRHYTSSWRYLSSVKEGANRVDLDGIEGDAVEKEHADHAALQLKESKAKAAEKRQENKKQTQDKKPFKNKTKTPSSTAVTKDAKANDTASKSPTANSAKNKHSPIERKQSGRKVQASVPKVKVRELLDEEYKTGAKVLVKVGSSPMPATITEVSKDDIQVQLNSGMTVKVKRAQLRLTL